MNKIQKFLVASAAGALMFGSLAVGAFADSVSVNFENPPYVTGSVGGQDGWSNSISPSVDQAVVTNSYGYASFNSQSFRMSNAYTDGAFGNWVYSKSLTDEAGELTAQNNGLSGGTRQTHFEVSFDLASTTPDAIQPGLQLSTAPDRGDGARMSYLRFEDRSDGIHVLFNDYQDLAPYGTFSNPSDGCGPGGDDWKETDIATLARSVPHNIKLTMDLLDGPRNDVVKVYIDGVLKQTGTSWEDYYRWCTESGGGVVNDPSSDVSRTVDSELFQARSGSGTAADLRGKGFLIDNLNLSSSTPLSATCPVGTTQSSVPLETVSVNSALSSSTPSSNNLVNGKNYLFVSSGTWVNSNNLADTEFTSVDNWATHMDGYDINPYFLGEGAFDLKIDGGFVNWGAYDGTNHQYSFLYPGNGIPANFLIFDGDSNSNTLHPEWYGDNSGSLSVKIYSCDQPVTPTPTPECKAAPAVAGELLKAASKKLKATDVKNYVSQVANHMGPQTTFNTVNACDVDAYKTAVKNYLNTLTPNPGV